MQLVRLDNNMTNNVDLETVTVLGSCANPFGNGTRLPCPVGTSYIGPDSRNISSTSAFNTTCCVSTWGWHASHMLVDCGHCTCMYTQHNMCGVLSG